MSSTHVPQRVQDASAPAAGAPSLERARFDMHVRLGVGLRHLGQLGAAIEQYNKALALQPNNAFVLVNVANALADQGRIDEALQTYRRAMRLKPDLVGAYEAFLLTLHYSDRVSTEDVFAAHRDYDARFAAPLLAEAVPHLNSPDPQRVLRIGYVSPDFHTHPVAFFIEPVLGNHDRAQFQTFCYSDVAVGDGVTVRLAHEAGTWRNIRGLRDQEVAELIRRDRIDILVDLAGHTGSRMLLFARKPAPVQVTYLGYPDTTGVRAIDYRITDAWADPDWADAIHTERLVRLDSGFLCYAPPTDSPPVAAAPVATNGFVTFASFNALAKLSPSVFRVWAEILKAVPRSRLLLKAKSLHCAATRKLVRNSFEQFGVTSERVTLMRQQPSLADHLATYGEADIGLDPFPYNGTTTTCDALWMGLPVITLAGRTHVGRVGVSILSRVGAVDLIAQDQSAYIQQAVTLANDIERLVELRRGFRTRLANSSLTRASDVTRALEGAFRAMWLDWCASVLGS